MKIIVIEGTDNTGKDTLIKGIKSHCKGLKVKEIHCTGPTEIDPIFAGIEQDYKFMQLVNTITNGKLDCDVLILNRSWYGEFVYGAIYRDRKRNDVKKMIWAIEEKLKDYDMSYIQLLSNSVSLLINNDDGKSLSNNNMGLMLMERKHFEQIIFHSHCKKKKIIWVNEIDGQWKSKDEILEEALKVIKK